MNNLSETLKKILEAPKQTPAKAVSEALSKQLRVGEGNRANDLCSQIEACLKRASGNDAPLPPIPEPVTIAKLDGAKI